MSAQRHSPPAEPSLAALLRNRTRFRFLGLTADDLIKYFFQGNAAVAILVLCLIMIFLFREGAGFFGQNLENIRVYRQAGLEYVDYVKGQIQAHTELTRALNALRMTEFSKRMAAGESIEAANEGLVAFDQFSTSFSDAIDELRGLGSDLGDAAIEIKQKGQIYRDALEQKAMLLRSRKIEEANAVQAVPVDFGAEVQALRAQFPAYLAASAHTKEQLLLALDAGAKLRFNGAEKKAFLRFQRVAQVYLASFPVIEAQMKAWRQDAPIPWSQAITAFLFGRDWITASFWQDFYGIVPLLVGSLLVSLIALIIAVPLGISGAIYVSEIAGSREKQLIKPCIEFISAIPSVVLGFFGVAILGQALRALSQTTWLSWIPGFPMSERLNSLTAGCLLALMAIPTIFSLAEDALSNVPKHFKEASFALGATRFQTITRVLVPASISGMISAILLGFGRVVGETMVVLLCAGNRIAIPDFTQGIGAFFQPVHTMTGIIAQEMGEVVPGSIHYRALFMVGIVLFLLALGINFLAQRIVKRYRISIG